MRVACFLRELRGARSLREVEDDLGIARGALSRYESGRELPLDRHVPTLERVYGPATGWYPPDVLLAIQKDEA